MSRKIRELVQGLQYWNNLSSITREQRKTEEMNYQRIWNNTESPPCSKHNEWRKTHTRNKNGKSFQEKESKVEWGKSKLKTRECSVQHKEWVKSEVPGHQPYFKPRSTLARVEQEGRAAKGNSVTDRMNAVLEHVKKTSGDIQSYIKALGKYSNRLYFYEYVHFV